MITSKNPSLIPTIVRKNYLSFAVGIIVVVAMGIVIAKDLPRQTESPSAKKAVQQTTVMPTTKPTATASAALTELSSEKTYIVQSGDSLWTIAEKFYGDGNKWTEITRRNFLPETVSPEAGTQLIIPSVTITPSNEANEKFPRAG